MPRGLSGASAVPTAETETARETRRTRVRGRLRQRVWAGASGVLARGLSRRGPAPGLCRPGRRDRQPERQRPRDGRTVSPGGLRADRPVRLPSPAQSACCRPHGLSVALSACPHAALGTPGSWSPWETVVGSPALDRRPSRPGLVDLVRPLALPPRACLTPSPGARSAHCCVQVPPKGGPGDRLVLNSPGSALLALIPAPGGGETSPILTGTLTGSHLDPHEPAPRPSALGFHFSVIFPLCFNRETRERSLHAEP